MGRVKARVGTWRETLVEGKSSSRLGFKIKFKVSYQGVGQVRKVIRHDKLSLFLKKDLSLVG